jgi:hypothetical protein
VKRLDIVRALFPGLQDEHFISALRARGGSLDEASDYLINLGAPHVDAKLALPGSKPDGLPELLRPIESQQVLSVLEVVGQRDKREVEAALRRTENDVEAAIFYILDTSEEGLQAAVVQDLQRHDAFEEAYTDFHSSRERTIQEVTNESVPEAVVELRNMYRVSDDESDAEERLVLATADGHCMVLHGNNEGPSDAGESAFCAVCTDEIPNKISGKRRCRMCLLCEGCIQSKVVFFCPLMGNGGHLHHHPLLPIEPGHRQRNHCDIGAEGCLRHSPNLRWFCPECDFDVCRVCMSRDIPPGFHRRLGRVDKAENEGDLFDDMDSDDEPTNQGGVNSGRPIFDECAAERVAAARWEGILTETTNTKTCSKRFFLTHPAFRTRHSHISFPSRNICFWEEDMGAGNSLERMNEDASFTIIINKL